MLPNLVLVWRIGRENVVDESDDVSQIGSGPLRVFHHVPRDKLISIPLFRVPESPGLILLDDLVNVPLSLIGWGRGCAVPATLPVAQEEVNVAVPGDMPSSVHDRFSKRIDGRHRALRIRGHAEGCVRVNVMRVKLTVSEHTQHSILLRHHTRRHLVCKDDGQSSMLTPVFNDLLRDIGDGPLHDNLVVFRVNSRVENTAYDGAVLSRRLHGDDLVRSTILVSKPTERFNGPRLTCANRPPEGNRHLTGKEDAQKINGHSAFNSFHFTVYDTNLACVQVIEVR